KTAGQFLQIIVSVCISPIALPLPEIPESRRGKVACSMDFQKAGACRTPNASPHTPPNASTQLFGDVIGNTTLRRVKIFRTTRSPMLEGAVHVGVHVTFHVPAAIVAVAIVLLLGLINMMR